MITQRRWWFTIPTLAAALFVVTGLVAAAAEPPDDIPPGMEWSPDDGLVSDLLAIDAGEISARTGRSHDETLVRLRTADRVDGILASLEDDPGFAGSWWAGEELVIAYVGGPSKAVLERVRDAATVTVQGRDVAYSMRSLERMQSDIHAAIEAAGVASKDIATGIDPRQQHVVVSVHASASTLKASIRDVVAEVAPREIADITFSDTAVFVDATTFGGALARHDAENECTSGFTVYKGSAKGVAIAAHCGSTWINKYKDWKTSAVHDMTYKNGHIGDFGDVEWFTTTGTEKPSFYRKNDGTRRTVTGVKNSFSQGDPLSGYGRRGSNYGGPHAFSGEVTLLNEAWNGAKKLHCIDVGSVDHGDSGGPVYSGSNAAGVMKGRLQIGIQYFACFSQARYLDDAIGVSVLLG